MVDAARIVVGLGRLRHRGLLHVAGPDVVTPRDLVRRLAAAIGVEPRLRLVSRVRQSQEVIRPRNVAMDASALRDVLPEIAPRPLWPAAEEMAR